MLKRSFLGFVAVLIIAIGGFAAYAWRPAIAPIAPPPTASFAADLIARGEVLAGAGNCAACHTVDGDKPLAGGGGMRTEFGTIYSSNITPDPQTGLGTWSAPAFARAMREGVARDGSHLFPAFPYGHFTKLTDDDVGALYAYFMTRTPVVATTPASTLPFPFNIRALQAGWKLLFFREGRFVAAPERGPEWNRGAYLAEGIAHCSACHTPRNWAGAEIAGQAYTGAAIEGWTAPPLTRANPSPLPWTGGELFAYLRTGVSRFHGSATGSMSSVIHEGLASLPDPDIQAMSVYFAEKAGAAARQGEIEPALARARAADARETALQYDADIRLYIAACAACHYNGDSGPQSLRPDLALNSAVHLGDPANLIRVILFGIGAQEGAAGVVMPGFAPALGDGEIARLAAYLRASRSNSLPWPDLEKSIATIRAQGGG